MLTETIPTSDKTRRPRQRARRGVCSVEECSNPHAAKSYCRAHYERVKASGRTDLRTAEERFWSRVERSETCWIWRGATATNGYGRFVAGNVHHPVHRFAWQAIRGDLPAGSQLDHRCHQRLCVNPDHLRPVTGWQNQQNHQGPTTASSTGVRGVFPASGRPGRYVIAVTLQGVKHRRGSFGTLEEAAKAVVELRNSLHTYNDMDRLA